MSLETDELISMVLDTGHATDCQFNPDASPVGATVRVFFDDTFLAQDAGTGTFENTQPQAYMRRSHASAVVPEVTVLLIEGQRFIASRKERVEGDNNWRLLILKEV
jgi:hypothetical protein